MGGRAPGAPPPRSANEWPFFSLSSAGSKEAPPYGLKFSQFGRDPPPTGNPGSTPVETMIAEMRLYPTCRSCRRRCSSCRLTSCSSRIYCPRRKRRTRRAVNRGRSACLISTSMCDVFVQFNLLKRSAYMCCSVDSERLSSRSSFQLEDEFLDTSEP